MKRAHCGTTTIEFAIIGSVLMVVVLAIVEFGRTLYVTNMLTEAARRGARLAAVCPIGDPRPASVAVFNSNNGSSSPVVNGLSTSNIQVQYLDVSSNPIASPAANFGNIRYVQVSIVGYTMPLYIPFIAPSLQLSGFTATLPRESLGVPRVGVIAAC